MPETPDAAAQAAYDEALAKALAKQNANEDLAVSVLWALSGRQFGACENVVRPCPPRSASYPFLPGHLLAREAGWWVDWPCGCSGGCTVAGPAVVHLPGPVAEVTAVTIAGEVLDPDGYQLEGDALYRKGGAWPGQDLGRPLGAPGTWSVTYLRGNPVPAGVAQLVGLLTKEFLAACDGGNKCRLPRFLTTTTRSGVTQAFDPTKILAAGMTGLPEIDTWLAAVNPHRLQEAPAVL